MLGRKFGHYEIVELLGKGGMGEVYRANDTNLRRDVALKLLPRELSADPERVARFAREARTLAALQHPNIASIYGFEEVESVRFLVMELVEGEELAARMAGGKLPMATALELAQQIAEGLEAAHDKGIVHRDLKPANIKLAANGAVKILDFGLARAMQAEAPSEAELANSPTITAAMTQQGVILGTAAYMSPEQARGGVADARADIWAFGVILFEMLSGSRLFEGETVSDTLASILKLAPDWSQLPAETPTRVRELLERCLAKKRRERLASIADARLELEWALAGRGEQTQSEAAIVRRQPWPLLAMLLLGVALGISLWHFVVGRNSAPLATAQKLRSLSVHIPEELIHLGEVLSPDGSCFAVRARLRNPASPAEAAQALYIRALEREEFRRVEGSLGFVSYGFSHDAKWLGLVAPLSAGSSQLRFWKVPVDGSAPAVSLFDWPKESRSSFLWLPNGDLLLSKGGTQILRIPTDGRPAAAPIDLKLPEGFVGYEAYPLQSQLLPDGAHLLTWSHSYLGDRYDQTGAVLNFETGEMKSLLPNAGAMIYSPTGHILFGRSGTLLALPFDLQGLSVHGTPVAVVSGLKQDSPWDHPSFDLSRDGTLAYYPGGVGGVERQIFWLNAKYEAEAAWSDDQRAFITVAVAANGGRLAASITGSDGYFDIWSSSVDAPSLNLWIEAPGQDCDLFFFSNDGRRLAYAVGGDKRRELRVRDADGTEQRLLEHSPNANLFPSCFVDADQALLFDSLVGTPSLRMLRLPRSLDPAAAPLGLGDLQEVLANASESVLSPDGRWLAYSSELSGRSEIYVRAWLGEGKLGEALRVSRDGGEAASWYTGGPDSPLQLRYRLGKDLYGAAFTAATPPRVTRPARIAVVDDKLLRICQLDDGRVLALRRDTNEGAITQIGIKLGFGAELERILGQAKR